MTLTLAYQMIDSNTFNYQNNLRNLFAAGDKSTQFLKLKFKKKLNFSIIEILFKGSENKRYL